MDIILKLCCISVFTVLISLSFKKIAPEIVLLMSVAVLISFIWAGIGLVTSVMDRLHGDFSELITRSDLYVPLVKYFLISVICQFCSALCKDCGQQSIALGIEYIGNIACIVCIFPLIESLIDVIKQLL